MLRESSKAWSNGSEAYSSDPEEDEEEEEDMVFGESDQDGVAEEMMDLSDLPTALFACSVHEAVFEQDVHRVSRCKRTFWALFVCDLVFVHVRVVPVGVSAHPRLKARRHARDRHPVCQSPVTASSCAADCTYAHLMLPFVCQGTQVHGAADYNTTGTESLRLSPCGCA